MIAVAPTDLGWYAELRWRPLPELVNFWTPTPWNVARLEPGDQFAFLLKSPYRKIGGYGEFVRYENMRVSEAWETFGIGNGVESLEELRARTRKYVDKHDAATDDDADPTIGCIILEQVLLFDEEDFFAPEERGMTFPRQVVKHKYFPEFEHLPVDSIDNAQAEGDSEGFSLIPYTERPSKTVTARERAGQPAFRRRVLEAYDGRCAISGESQGELIEAAHIQPYRSEQSNHVQNGIALRVDLHRLFDAGLLTITQRHRVRVSPHLSSQAYASFEGSEIRLPEDMGKRPSAEALHFHNRSVFRE